MSQLESIRKKFNCGVRVSAYLALVGFFVFLSFIRSEPLSAAESGGGAALKISRITPSGVDIPPGRQIVFEFDRPVVPLGRMQRSPSEVPISIEPSLSCQWRWLNPSNLACQLDEQHAMAPSTRYNITVRPEIKAEDGAALAEPVTHSFITIRSLTDSAAFDMWLSPVKPQTRVRFNQAVRKDSLESHVFYREKGGARVSAKVLEDDRYVKSNPGISWLFSPAVDLREDSAAELVVEPGIQSVRGGEPGVESRAIFSFRTLGPFRFEGVRCFDLRGNESIISPGPSGAPQGSARNACNPESSVSLIFSSPVAQSELKKKVSVSLVGKEVPVDGIWPESEGFSEVRQLPEKGGFFSYEIDNEVLKPFSKYRIRARAKDLTDEFGRALIQPVDMRFPMDHLPPQLLLYKNMSVLEKGIETELPVFACNIGSIDLKYQATTASGKSGAKSVVLPGPRVRDITTVIPLGIRKLIGAESGVLTGTVTARPPIVRKDQEPNWFFAQVTPFDVHIKMGHFNTLVWITDLGTGEPVPGVRVEVRKDSYKDLGAQAEVLSEGLDRCERNCGTCGDF